jgi:hypothetical protein
MCVWLRSDFDLLGLQGYARPGLQGYRAVYWSRFQILEDTCTVTRHSGRGPRYQAAIGGWTGWDAPVAAAAEREVALGISY